MCKILKDDYVSNGVFNSYWFDFTMLVTASVLVINGFLITHSHCIFSHLSRFLFFSGTAILRTNILFHAPVLDWKVTSYHTRRNLYTYKCRQGPLDLSQRHDVGTGPELDHAYTRKGALQCDSQDCRSRSGKCGWGGGFGRGNRTFLGINRSK